MEKRTFRAVFFDLDGTLLPMDVDVFMKSYFRALGGYVARMGIAPDQFMAGMKRGITAMATNDSGHANAESFWPEFLACIDLPEGVTADALQAAIGDFYENEFGELGADVQPNPAAARAIEALAAKGYPLVLATMPMFPRRAVEWRLRWAGIDPAVFSRITTFENSTAVKP
ncbi:HAD family hydrolase, partial [Senegalimassilia anaerobia]|uniref:HAD family hydrolase n=1 Tax=Senegalimassilia anaerobia TaxID=1473216 RepID=UPI003A9849C2